MPAVVAGVVEIFSLRDDRLVEGLVVGVLQLDILETLIFWNEAVADDLHLRLVRDGL